MLEGIQGARVLMDDILLRGTSDGDHDKVLRNVIDRAIQWNLGLNFEKHHLKNQRIHYAGHTVTEHGLEPNQEKVCAVVNTPMPKDKGDVRRFGGMLQYLSKFIPNMITIDAPLRELLKKETGVYQYPVLARCEKKTKEITIQFDASCYALGGVLLQDGRPVAYT